MAQVNSAQRESELSYGERRGALAESASKPKLESLVVGKECVGWCDWIVQRDLDTHADEPHAQRYDASRRKCEM